MRRPSYELLRNLDKLDPIPPLKSRFPYLMLLDMMMAAKADDPPIRGLHTYPTIGAAADMRALDRPSLTANNRAGMPAHPLTMCRAAPALLLPPTIFVKPLGQHHAASFFGSGRATASRCARIVSPTAA